MFADGSACICMFFSMIKARVGKCVRTRSCVFDIRVYLYYFNTCMRQFMRVCLCIFVYISLCMLHYLIKSLSPPRN